MKIAFFIYALRGGGAERVTAHLAGQLARLGHHVVLLTMQEQSPDDYPVPDSVERHVLYTPPAAGLPLLTRIARLLERVVRFRRELREIAPDCLVSMMTRENTFAIVASTGTGIPCVVAERNDPASTEYGAVQSLLRKILYPFADGIVVQTRAGQQWLESALRTRRVVSIANPIVYPLPRGEPVVDATLPAGMRRVLVVGRLTPQKQIDHALRAFQATGAAHDGWQLTVIGDGPLKASLQTLATDLQLGDAVRFVPRAGNLGDWYAASDILLMTSAYEGFPNALVEAMSHGVPVISYDCRTGPAEIITEGTDGFLIPPGDIASLSHAMMRLIRDDDLRARTAAAASLTRHRFSLTDISEQWLEMIRRAIHD